MSISFCGFLTPGLTAFRLQHLRCLIARVGRESAADGNLPPLDGSRLTISEEARILPVRISGVASAAISSNATKLKKGGHRLNRLHESRPARMGRLRELRESCGLGGLDLFELR